MRLDKEFLVKAAFTIEALLHFLYSLLSVASLPLHVALQLLLALSNWEVQVSSRPFARALTDT